MLPRVTQQASARIKQRIHHRKMNQNIDTNLLLWGEMDPGHQKERAGDSSRLELAGQETIR